MIRTREEAWQQFAKDNQFPAHEHGPTEAQPRLSTRNYFRQCFEAGWEAALAAEDLAVQAHEKDQHEH